MQHPLRLWLASKGYRLSPWGRAHGFLHTTLSMITNYRIVPSRKMAERISKATNGELSPVEIMWPQGVPDYSKSE